MALLRDTATASTPGQPWRGKSCSSPVRLWRSLLRRAAQTEETPSSPQEDGPDHRRHRRAFRLSGSQIKEAETWDFCLFEQTLVYKLFLELLDLHSRHFTAIRGYFAISLRAQLEQLVLRGGHGQRGQK